jgi:hypothetical protein
MNDILNHYQLNNFLKEIIFNSFSFIKNILISNTEIDKPSKLNIDVKKEIELYEKYLIFINSKIDNYLDAR